MTDPHKGDARRRAIDIELGKRVRLRRSLLQMSQDQLAPRLDMSHQKLHRYEQGE